jgi:hypothetical protein
MPALGEPSLEPCARLGYGVGRDDAAVVEAEFGRALPQAIDQKSRSA